MEYRSIGLLEIIAHRAGCTYISDLQNYRFTYFVPRIMDKIDPYAFSIHEWEDAVHYITGEKIEFEDQGMAAHYMKKVINKKESVV